MSARSQRPIRRGDVEEHVRSLGGECFADERPGGRRLTTVGLRAALAVLPGWRASEEGRALARRFACRGLGESLLFVQRVAAAMSRRGARERLRFTLDEGGVAIELSGPEDAATVAAVDLAGELNEGYELRGRPEKPLEAEERERLLEIVPHWRSEAGAAMVREFLFPGEAPALWFAGRALGAVRFAESAPRVAVRFDGRSVEVRLTPRHGGAITGGQIEAASEVERLAEEGGDGESEPRNPPLGATLDAALGWRGPWGTPGALHALLGGAGKAQRRRPLTPRAAARSGVGRGTRAGRRPRSGRAAAPPGGSRGSSR